MLGDLSAAVLLGIFKLEKLGIALKTLGPLYGLHQGVDVSKHEAKKKLLLHSLVKPFGLVY